MNCQGEYAPTPQQTEGPYYRDLDLVRSDIREDRPGVALGLGIRIVDTAGTAVEGAVVDVWHCDALGVYSWHGNPVGVPDGEAGASLSPGTFLRGRQMTDATGGCRFRTLYPGWYSGRSVHIHAKVRHSSGELITQLYFPEALTDTVHQREPYRSRPRRDTVNTDDVIYDDVGEATLLHPVADPDGYSADITLVTS